MAHVNLSLDFLVFLCAAGMAGWVPESARGAPDWEQVNSNGFGDPQTLEVTALEAFNGYLYAGTHNPIDPEPLFDGAQIFRSPDGVTWTAVTQPGFGNTHDIAAPAILDFTVFNNRLYASTGRGNASQVWRSLNGTTWAPMNVTGFSDPENVNVNALTVYNGMIYAGVTNQVTGAQVWRSFTGDNNTWEQIAPAVPGTAPASVTGFTVFEFDGGLYAAIEFEADAPAQIWRSYGGAWEIVMNDGFGDANTLSTGGMVEFLGELYAAAGNTAVGAQLWRSAGGDVWTQAIAPGFGDRNNREAEMLFVFQNQLYASVKNVVTGIEIWRTADGALWEQVNVDGFGDSRNTGTNGSNATAEFLGQLYVGGANIVDGGELWRRTDAPEPTALQLPGDCNQDGRLDISDGICVFGFLFLGQPSRLPCGDGSGAHPANIALTDANGDGRVDLSDGVYVLSYLFGACGQPECAPPVLGTACVRIVDCPSVCTP